MRKIIKGISTLNPVDVEKEYLDLTVDYAISHGFDHYQLIGPIHDAVRGNIDGMTFSDKSDKSHSLDSFKRDFFVPSYFSIIYRILAGNVAFFGIERFTPGSSHISLTAASKPKRNAIVFKSSFGKFSDVILSIQGLFCNLISCKFYWSSSVNASR